MKASNGSDGVSLRSAARQSRWKKMKAFVTRNAIPNRAAARPSLSGSPSFNKSPAVRKDYRCRCIDLRALAPGIRCRFCLLQMMARQLSSEDRRAVEGCVNALFTLLAVFGFTTGHDQLQRLKAATRLQWCAGSVLSKSWMKFVKWKAAAFFHAYSDSVDVAPPCPMRSTAWITELPHVLCSGRAGRFASAISKSARGPSFLSSVLQLKKGCPRPGKKLVDQTVAAAVTALTVAHEEPAETTSLLPWGDVVVGAQIDNSLTRGRVEAELRRTVRELFRGHTYTDAMRHRPIFPSTRACVERSKGLGGASAALMPVISDVMGSEYNMPWEAVDAEDFILFRKPLRHAGDHVRSLTLKLSVPVWRVIHPTIPTPEWKELSYERREDLDSDREEIEEGPHFTCDLRELESDSRRLYAALMARAVNQVSLVVPVGLPESLKVRVISKGRAALGKVLHPMQKFMWSVVKSHPTFRLIGEPVTERVVQDGLGARLGDNEYYLSGDYSAATDNLAPWVSNCIANCICDESGMTAEERLCFLKSLTGNVFLLKGDKREEPKLVPQAWGQLMGSIVSFPVLCIANAALCRMALEVDCQRFKDLRATSILVNGDDVVFRTTLRGHKLWERITAFAGLTSSIGKTFLSRSFAQINSVNYQRLPVPVIQTVDGRPRPLWFKETPYVNLGLLFGLKRSGEIVGADSVVSAGRDGTLGARCRDLLRTCPADLKVPVMSTFLRYHHDILTSVKVPWYVPESWGGVGLPTVIQDSEIPDPGEVPTFVQWGPHELDLRVAARLRECPKDVNGRPKYPVQRPPASWVDWPVHKAVMEQLPYLQWGHPSATQERDFARLYGQLCVDRLFNAPESFWNLKAELVVVGGPCALCGESQKDHDDSTHEFQSLPHPKILKHQKHVMQVLRSNERSWRSARQHGNLPPPLSPSTLLSEDPEKPFLQVTFLSDLQPPQPFEFETVFDSPEPASFDELMWSWLVGYNWN